MDFYPAPHEVPGGFVTDEFILEPLTTEHVALDHAALMDSTEMLRLWSGTTWPTDDFTLAENWEDLDRHAREHEAREAFTYTVLSPARDECVGCVYIQPPTMFGGDPVDWSHDLADNSALVAFWVRAPRLADGLDERLLRVLRQWLASDWEFPQVYFTARVENTQQCRLLEGAGMALTSSIDLGVRGRVHLFQPA
jgi:RimJ/RimL family protein N-acetyltransferase